MIRYETHLPLLNSAKPFKEHFANREAGDNFIVNWHQSLELLYVTDGDVEVVTNDVSVRARGGDLAVVNSSYLHDIICHSRCSYYCLIINIDFLVDFGIKIDEIEFERLVSTPRVRELINRIRSLCEAKDKNYELVAKAEILSLISELFVKHSHPREKDSELGGGRIDGAREIIKYLQGHFGEKISLDTISAAVGYNKHYVSHIFKSLTGVTVMTYLNMLRIFHARDLLKTKKHTVSEVCRMCGFENLSYFTRTYKKYVGALPSREHVEEKKSEPEKKVTVSEESYSCYSCY